jgi:hypothetical protein
LFDPEYQWEVPGQGDSRRLLRVAGPSESTAFLWMGVPEKTSVPQGIAPELVQKPLTMALGNVVCREAGKEHPRADRQGMHSRNPWLRD